MHLQFLALKSFRNIADAELHPAPGVNLVTGDNGQGKTNLVESVCFLAWLRSFRTSRTADLVADGAEAAHLRATVQSHAARHDFEVSIAPGIRRAVVDGHPARSVRDTLGHLCAVWLSPDDPAVLEGGPEGRRTLLDRFAVLRNPDTAALFSRYGRLVRERNAALKTPSWDTPFLDACETALAEAGARILALRLDAIEALRARIPAILAQMSGPELTAEIRYASKWAPGDPAHAVGVLRDALRLRRAADASLGYTTVGPHVDDADVSLLGRRCRGFASRGQRKVLLLAWKVAEAADVSTRTGEWPVLVLDDALADLDASRQGRVVESLAASGAQVFVTSAMKPPGLPATAAVFRAVQGTFSIVGG